MIEYLNMATKKVDEVSSEVNRKYELLKSAAEKAPVMFMEPTRVMSNEEEKRYFSIQHKATKAHRQFLVKNNIFTESKNGVYSVSAMKMEDVLLLMLQETGEVKHKILLSDFRTRMYMERNNDYKKRIQAALLELKTPVELKMNFNLNKNEVVEWSAVSFLRGNPKIVKHKTDGRLYVYVEIDKEYLALKADAAGYTLINPIEGLVCSTKYTFKIYQQIYLQYRNLPNRHDSTIVTVGKDIHQLNEMFGTSFSQRQPSAMMRGIKRGVEEILKMFDVMIVVFYNKDLKKFIFSWAKEIEDRRCIIPSERVKELVEWVMVYGKNKIKNEFKYRKKIKSLIMKNELEGIEELYRGMLQRKYKMTKDEIDATCKQNGHYRDFTKEATLF